MAAERTMYATVKMAKTEKPVPVFDNGIALHSLYDPDREARQLIDTIPSGSFVVFAGIGGGFHIREYLARNPGCSCIVAESSARSLEKLSSLVDISEILADPRVTVVADCTDETILKILSDVYLPAIHGDFRLVALRSWQGCHEPELSVFAEHLRTALSGISADFSVQSHFGKLWFRNVFINLGIAASMDNGIPAQRIPLSGKKAVVAAAGPGLETMLADLRAKRNRYVIFSTDTAYGTLADSGIVPDFFVSIDAQSVSARHAMHQFSPETTIILDLCGNPDIALRARSSGSRILYAAGGHPLARYAARFGQFPLFDTSSGTVTLAALDCAHAYGFTDVLLPGADFAYVNGKPYARGTYLEHLYGSDSNRLHTSEHAYTALMFRTPVTRVASDGGLTYGTAVLDRYALACRQAKSRPSENHWNSRMSGPFPFEAFVMAYRKDLESLSGMSTQGTFDRTNSAFVSILPFIAWYRASCVRQGTEPDVEHAIKLALDLIARYTGIS